MTHASATIRTVLSQPNLFGRNLWKNKARCRRLAMEELETRQVMAAADPFSADAPAFDYSAPEPTPFQRGDYSVSEKTGAATYTYPIEVPPGRGGMEPNLRLTYSSRAPLRGGIAAGWSFPLPVIQVDTSGGTDGLRKYMAALDGSVGRLVETPDIAIRGGVTYRVTHDDAFTIFERFVPFTPDLVVPPPGGGMAVPVENEGSSSDGGTNGTFGTAPVSGGVFAGRSAVAQSFGVPLPGGGDQVYVPTEPTPPSDGYSESRTAWLARTTNGVTHFFGLSAKAKDTRWMLNRQIDRFGNRVDYHWNRIELHNGGVDFVLDFIEYTSNDNAGLSPHARVDFDYAQLEIIPGTRTPVGASVSYRTGQLTYEGARRLTAIVTSVRDEPRAPWREVRRVSLDYDLEAIGYESGQLTGRTDASPIRYLTNIRAVAYNLGGQATTIPPVTFTYGDDARPFDQQKTINTVVPPKHDFSNSNSTLMDINGDGMLDRVEVRVAEPASPTPTGQCELAWHAGVHGGGFGLREYVMPLPTYFWGGSSDGSVPAGSEDCSMNGQKSVATIQTSNRITMRTGLQNVFRFADWDGDGDADLATQAYYDQDYYEDIGVNDAPNLAAIAATNGQPASMPFVTPTFGDAGASAVNNAFSAIEFAANSSNDSQDGNQNCGQDEQQQTAANQGSGQPTEDPSCGSVEPNPDSMPWEDFMCAFTDCRADPPVDRPAPTNRLLPQRQWGESGDHVWRLYRNLGSHFEPTSPTTLTSCNDHRGWINGSGSDSHGACLSDFELNAGTTRDDPRYAYGTYNLADWNGDGFMEIVSALSDQLVAKPPGLIVKQLEDINGDGLLDLVTGVGSLQTGTTLAKLHDGAGIATDETIVIDGYSYVARKHSTGDLRTRNQEATIYHVDVDGDGLLDLLDLNRDSGSTSGEPHVYFNVGGEFNPNPYALDYDFFEYAVGRVEGVDLWLDGQSFTAWVQTNAYVDADGDGLRDLVKWDAPFGTNLSSWRETIFSQNINGDPPRRLVEVDNGVGGTVNFRYSPITNPQVVSRNLVDRHQLPHIFWIVDAITLSDAYGPPSTTSYSYSAPVYGSQTGRPDDPRQFLGFSEVTMDLPAGGRVVTTYDYSVPGDARGHLSKETVYDRKNGGFLDPVSHRQLSLISKPLFGGQVDFTYSSNETTYTCAVGVLDCVTDAAGVFRVRHSYRPINHPENGQVAHYVQNMLTEDDRLGDSTLERRTISISDIRYTDSEYLILNTLTQEWARDLTDVDSKYVMTGASVTRYNEDGLPVRVEELISRNRRSITVNEFDRDTGNPTSTAKPEQFAEGPMRSTSFEYDPFQIFVSQTVNEMRHELFHTYDLGTGQLLVQRGPNFKQVGATKVFETEIWQRDGLGRIYNHLVSRDDPNRGYRLISTERIQYVDDQIPRRVRQKQRLDFNQWRWTAVDTVFDGWGKVLRKAQNGDEGRATTHYQYDEGGNLNRITMPKPGSNDPAEVVQYIYERDGLSRVRRFTRPDGNSVSIDFDGLLQTTTELTTDGSGKQTLAREDAFGRLLELVEIGGSHGPAVWRYRYDAADRVTSIIDADNNLTELTYDWAGQRRSITRGGRSWQYDYDLNGNLIAETTPVSDGGAPANYTTRTAYDALDRTILRTPASRGMSAQRLAQLAIAPIEFYYDGTQGPPENSIGRLSRVELPVGNVLYQYDAQGLVAREERSFAVDYLVQADATQWIEREYNPLGLPTVVRHDDGTVWRTTYDRRGLVASVDWYDPDTQMYESVANYDRSLSGQVVRRNSNFEQSRTVQYDDLGRPIRDEVFADEVLLAERDYNYSDSGDLIGVNGQTDGISADASYSYDGLHRLITARGPNGYSGKFSYSSAGNILTASVDWNDSPSARSVAYVYGARDAQAVDTLIDQATSDPWASFEYNIAGAMTRRETQQGVWTFELDNQNMIREANGPNGTEVYYYDHNGQRIISLNENEARFTFGPSETRFSSEGEKLLRYLHVAGTGSTLARIQVAGNDTAQIELQYADSLNNLMLSLDENGQATAAFLYGPFGEVVLSEGENDHNRRFNGKEVDDLTGLRYYGYRHYDPLTLRWTAADPLYTFMPDLALTDPQRINLYSFSLNNAVRFYDPDGRDPKSETKNEIDPCRNRADVCLSFGEGVWTKPEKNAQESSLSSELAKPLVKLGLELAEHGLDHEIKAAAEILKDIGAHDAVAQGRLNVYTTGNKILLGGAAKVLAAWGIYKGAKRMSGTRDIVEQSRGALDVFWSSGSMAGGKIGIVFAAGSVGNALGQWIDEKTGFSEDLGDFLYDVLPDWPFD